MLHRLHLYTGSGKGKTTAAMGLALRALGHDLRVTIAQFMKDGSSGELRGLAALGACLHPAPLMHKFTFQMTAEELAAAAELLTAHARALTAGMEELQPDLLVLDEFAIAADLGLIAEDAAKALIDAALARGEVAVTGASAPRWLIDRADYLSCISAQRHPFTTEGLPARKGVEW